MYINKNSILGMGSTYYEVDNENLFIYKNKAKDKIAVFENSNFENFNKQNYKEISYEYYTSKPGGVKSYKLTELISAIPKDYFEVLKSYNKDWHETMNKWDKRIVIKTEPNSIDEVINMIKTWEENSGKKYRMNMRSGADKSYFRKYFELNKENLQNLFFYFEDILVGYSVIEKEPENNEYKYVIRKMNVLAGRNICQYIDLKTMKILREKNLEEFYVNWGASGGGVLNYKKRIFPVKSAINYFFFKEA
jgi:hypothetical protein